MIGQRLPKLKRSLDMSIKKSLIETLQENRDKKAKELIALRKEVGSTRAIIIYSAEMFRYNRSDSYYLTKPIKKDLEELKMVLEDRTNSYKSFDSSDMPCGLQDYYYEEDLKDRELLEEVNEALQQLEK